VRAGCLLSDREDLDKVIAETVADLITPLMGGYDALMVPATSAGKNFAPRIAAKLDVAPLSDVVEIIDANTFTRPIYAGNALQTVQSSDAKKVITVRPTAFKAAGQGGQAPIEELAPPAAAEKTRFVGEEIVKSERPELGAAKIVVSGGRAMGSAEEFHRVLDPLADLLGAAVGASARRWTPATRPTTTRSARPARWSRRTSTSPSASRAPSSTWRA
jgi:electron transfer flavoprotein alpha subunit